VVVAASSTACSTPAPPSCQAPAASTLVICCLQFSSQPHQSKGEHPETQGHARLQGIDLGSTEAASIQCCRKRVARRTAAAQLPLVRENNVGPFTLISNHGST
jgi:hypothetical protein